jgi:hypothetical protein
MRWVRDVVQLGEKNNNSRFNEETWRKRPPEGPRHRWKIGIKIYHK